MKPDPKVAQDIHRRVDITVPHVPNPIKEPRIQDIYNDIRIIRRWVLCIGIIVVITLVGVVLLLLGPF